MANAKITFYKIDRCGLYVSGALNPALGDLSSFLQQLKRWVVKNDKTLDETCTFGLVESEGVERTFCYDLASDTNTGDYLLTTWNEIVSYNGRVAAVPSGSRVGNAKVEFTSLPKNSIPGYATYFWFVPAKSVYATIRFQSRLNGKRNLEKYLREFIGKFSDYVILSDYGDSDLNIAGYRAKPEDPLLNLYPQFSSSVVKRLGQVDYIIKNRINIRKITRHNTLSPGVKNNQESWQKLLRSLGIKKEKILSVDVRLTYDFPFTPTEEELKEIIDEWESSHDSRWDDVGFTFACEQSPRWLSHSVAKDDFELETLDVANEIHEATSILEALASMRDSILAVMHNP